jgi:four helix bundle protein
MPVKSFEDLIVWQKGMDFVAGVYKATAIFPKEELYGLTSQLRRAAVSIPSNIAEGQSRRTTGEFLQMLSVASGSLAECQTQLLLAKRLGFVPEKCCESLLSDSQEIGRLLGGLVNSLKRSRQSH